MGTQPAMSTMIAAVRLRLRLEQFEEAERRLIIDQCTAGAHALCACLFFASVFLLFGVGLR